MDVSIPNKTPTCLGQGNSTGIRAVIQPRAAAVFLLKENEVTMFPQCSAICHSVLSRSRKRGEGMTVSVKLTVSQSLQEKGAEFWLLEKRKSQNSAFLGKQPPAQGGSADDLSLTDQEKSFIYYTRQIKGVTTHQVAIWNSDSYQHVNHTL